MCRKDPGPRSRRFDGDEARRLLAAAGPHLRACIGATLETGLRKSEILGVEWQHITTAGMLLLPGTITKTGVGRTAIVTTRQRVILDMRAATQRVARNLAADATLPGDLHPFGNELGERVGDFRTAWRLACKRAGITSLHFHDLRRESGSQLAETPGVSLTDVRDFLGHQSVAQTNTYLATTTLRLRDALAKRDAARTRLAQPLIEADTDGEMPTVSH